MFDSPEELLGKIRLGEDTSLELKAVDVRGSRVAAPARDDLADEIAAMANTAEGVLVSGGQSRYIRTSRCLPTRGGGRTTQQNWVRCQW